MVMMFAFFIDFKPIAVCDDTSFFSAFWHAAMHN